MKLSRFIFNSLTNSARLATSAFAVSTMLTLSAHAQTTPTFTPHSHFGDATITSTDSTIDAIRVPAYDDEGQVHYWDIQFNFEVSAEGVLSLAPGYPTFAKSDNPLTAHFVPGTYVGPSGTINGSPQTIVVTGPGVTSGASTEWSLALASGASGYTYPASATWYVGSITNNPLAARIKKAGITSTVYTYGILGVNSYGGPDWETGALLGFAQTGNSITIVSFSYEGTDSSTPLTELTYQKK